MFSSKILKYSILKEGHNHLVKECAKIAVYEIMEVIGWDEMNPEDRDDYWDDVIREINAF